MNKEIQLFLRYHKDVFYYELHNNPKSLFYDKIPYYIDDIFSKYELSNDFLLFVSRDFENLKNADNKVLFGIYYFMKKTIDDNFLLGFALKNKKHRKTISNIMKYDINLFEENLNRLYDAIIEINKKEIGTFSETAYNTTLDLLLCNNEFVDMFDKEKIGSLNEDEIIDTIQILTSSIKLNHSIKQNDHISHNRKKVESFNEKKAKVLLKELQNQYFKSNKGLVYSARN